MSSGFKKIFKNFHKYAILARIIKTKTACLAPPSRRNCRFKPAFKEGYLLPSDLKTNFRTVKILKFL